MIAHNKRTLGILLVIVLLLFIPLIAMQFTNEVKWSLMDFIVMGALLLFTGFGCEVVIRKVKGFRYRVAICLAIAAAFFIVWLELAVGIF